MKIRKVLILLLFPLIAEVAVSCCNCLETTTKHYTNKSVRASHLDNGDKLPVIATRDSVRKQAYGIRVQLDREETAGIRKRSSLFLETAYAYDCFCPSPFEFLPKDTITSIRIFTLSDFDASHAANAEISGYFKAYSRYSFSTIADYLKYSATILENELEMDLDIDLLLVTPPAGTGKYSFRIEAKLSDGRILEATTSEIILT